MHYNFYVMMFQHYHARSLRQDWRNTHEELIVKQHEAYYAAAVAQFKVQQIAHSLLRA